MDRSYGVEVECRHIGEFVEQADTATRAVTALASAVAVRFVGDFTEQCEPAIDLQEFKVMLESDARVVYGHGLKPVVVGNDACVGVWQRSEGEGVLVARFPLRDTVGVFTGDLQVAP